MDIKPAPYHELLRVLTVVDPQDPAPVGCPICKLVRKGLLAYLDDLIYSCGVDPQVRGVLREARGLCNRHAHLFTEVVGLALGVTLIGWDVIDSVNEELAKHKPDRGRSASRSLMDRLRPGNFAHARLSLQNALRPSKPCMACEHQAKIEQIYLSALLEHLSDGALQTALRNSPGLCLPHYGQAVEWARDGQTLALLTEIESAALTRLSAALQELARKYDHRYQHEPVGPEGDAWKRSIDQIVGARGMR